MSVTDGLAYLLEIAPSDVAQTIQRLLASGADVLEQSGGRAAPFGDVLVVLGLSGAEVGIGRERGAWYLDAGIGGSRRFELDLLHRARIGEPTYISRSAGSPEDPSQGQLPEGLSWSDELPLVLDWLQVTPGAVEALDHLSRDRFTQFFGFSPP